MENVFNSNVCNEILLNRKFVLNKISPITSPIKCDKQFDMPTDANSIKIYMQIFKT